MRCPIFDVRRIEFPMWDVRCQLWNGFDEQCSMFNVWIFVWIFVWMFAWMFVWMIDAPCAMFAVPCGLGLMCAGFDVGCWMSDVE